MAPKVTFATNHCNDATAGANNRDSTAAVIKQEHKKGKSLARVRDEHSDKGSDLDEPPVKNSMMGCVAAADTKKTDKKIAAIAAVTVSRRTAPRNKSQFTTK